MAGRTKRDLEEENLELREQIESVYDQLAGFLGVDEGEEEDEDDEEDD